MTAKDNSSAASIAIQERIAQRAFVHMVSMIHVANYDRKTMSGDPKVGGHPASCASSLHILSALHLDVREPQDYICCKPHASPMDHSLQHQLGLFRHNDMVDWFAPSTSDEWFTQEDSERIMTTLR
jgi:pyruvate dehydrogenase E1 component